VFQRTCWPGIAGVMAGSPIRLYFQLFLFLEVVPVGVDDSEQLGVHQRDTHRGGRLAQPRRVHLFEQREAHAASWDPDRSSRDAVIVAMTPPPSRRSSFLRQALPGRVGKITDGAAEGTQNGKTLPVNQLTHVGRQETPARPAILHRAAVADVVDLERTRVPRIDERQP